MNRFALAALLALLPAAAHAGDNDLRSVAGMQFHQRVLLVFTPTLADARLQAQRGEMAKFAVGAMARDLAFVQVDPAHVIGASDKAEKLRRTYRAAPDAYRTLLIGKDGKVALERPGPIDRATLERTIDAMPMRQEEVRRARAGRPAPPPGG